MVCFISHDPSSTRLAVMELRRPSCMEKWWWLWASEALGPGGGAKLCRGGRPELEGHDGWLGSWSCGPGSPREICRPLNFHIEICFRSCERSVGCGRLDLHHRFPCWSRSFKFISGPAKTTATAYWWTYKHLDRAWLNEANKTMILLFFSIRKTF